MELTDDYRQIMALMDEPELDPQTLKDTMEGIEGAFEDKFDGYAAVIRTMQGNLKTLEEEKKRIDARMKSWENNIKRMKEIMLFAMNETGKTKFKTAFNSFWTQKNKAAVVMDEEDFRKIPEDYLRYKDPEPDKAAIEKAIASGVDLSGIAHMEQSESVRWR